MMMMMMNEKDKTKFTFITTFDVIDGLNDDEG